MRIQLWSYNYDPEPSGIAPLSGVWAREMKARGHDVTVVAAHPHYPEPRWGTRLLPYREVREGVPLLRLPLWIGRGSAIERMRQDGTFSAVLSAAMLTLPTPDVIIAVSPSFPALLPAMVNAKARRIPWMLWLQDILPDGAAATGILEEGRVVELARKLERAAYRSAERIVVISESFKENLRAKQVPEDKLVLSYNPASKPILTAPRDPAAIDPRLVLTMGNIGHSQNLAPVVRSFEDSDAVTELGARFVLAGDGDRGDEVRAAIRTDRVHVTGVLKAGPLEGHLDQAAVAVVSQGYEGIDFNVPSKLMNFMAYGIPVVASVRPDSEVARIIASSGCGWTTDSSDTGQLAAKLAGVLRRPDELERRGAAGRAFAMEHFAPEPMARRFEAALDAVV